MENLKRARRKSINDREFLIAVIDENLDEVERLLNEGVDVNLKDCDGYTALHLATVSGNENLVDLLVKSGASISVKNNDEETPLDIARRLNKVKIISILEAKVDRSAKTYEQKDILQNQEKIVEIYENKHGLWINPVYDNIYQLKVLMLFLYRGVALKYSFRLRTEMKEARKFDDLIFECNQNGRKIYRLLQAKHKIDESKKITADNLLFNANDDYNLVKYYFSYQALKKDDFLKKGSIKDVTICTNIDFDFENLKEAQIEVEKVLEKDDILDVQSEGKQPTRYKFSKSLITKLKIRLQMHKLASTYDTSEAAINDFLGHLVFAVNQPNEEELGDIVKHEIRKEFDFITTENAYNKFFIQMLDWMKARTGVTFWSYKDGKNLFDQVKKRISIWYNVQDPVKSFTGRRDQLKHLHELLQTDDQSRICVSGFGGVGKSELVKKYIAEYSQCYDNKVIWINAENYRTLVDSFRELACDKLGIKTKNANEEDKDISIIVAETYQYFSNGKSLFVFDNSQMYESQHQLDAGIDRFLPCLPSGCENPHIIITSRNQKWPKNVKVQILEGFTEKEATTFITGSLQLKNEEQNDKIIELGRKLQLSPLALQQAVSYISVQNEKFTIIGSSFQISNYLTKLSQRNKDIFSFDFSNDNENAYAQAVFTTWNVTLNALKERENGSDALDILNVLSYLLPDNIPIELLSIFIKDKEKLATAIQLLKRYSLLTVQHKAINLHRLVQQVTRLYLSESNREKQILEGFLKKIRKQDVTFKNVDHFISIWKYSKQYVELVEKYHFLSTTIMKTLNSCARNDEVHQMAMEILQIFQQIPSNNINAPISLMETKECIANAFLKQGKYKRALKVYEELYESQEKSYGLFHDETLNAKCNVATTLCILGRHKEALKMFSELLRMRNVLSGENHPSTLTIKTHIAGILMDEGKWEEAKPIVQQIYESEKKLYGDNHIDTIDTKSNLATILLAEHKSNEALKILEDIYKIRKTFQSENNLNVIITRSNIAKAYEQQNKYDLAIETYEDILKANSPVLGENHPQIMSLRTHMALNMHLSGKRNKALKILQELFAKQRDTLGLHHPDVLRTQYTIADILKEQGKYSEALQNYEELLRYEIQVIGNEHSMTLATRDRMSQVLIQLEQYDKALEHSLEVMKIRKKKLKMNDPMTLDVRKDVGVLYYYKKDYEKALSILVELAKDQEEVLGKDDPEYVDTRRLIEKILSEKVVKRKNLIQTSNDPFAAVKSGNLALLKDLMKKGVDVNVKDEIGMTLLHHATRGNQIEIVKFLLNNGCNLTQVSGKGNTVLHIAALENYIDIVKILLESVKHDELRKFIDAKTTTSRTTALHIASTNGYYELARLLLSCGATYELKDKNGKRSVDVAKDQIIRGFLEQINKNFEQVKIGKKEEIRELLENCPYEEFLAFMNARNYDGFNILQIAIINNHQNIVKILLSSKVESFRRNGHKPSFNTQHFDELLSLATNTLTKFQDESCTLKTSLKHVRKFVSTFRSFDKRIVDPNILAIEDMLRLISCQQDMKFASELIKQVIATHLKLFSASIYSVKLLESTRCKDWFLAEKCINEMANVNLSDEGGWTPLLHAINGGNERFVKMLIDHGAQVNCATKTGKNTSLHIAANKGNLEIIGILLEQDETSEFVNAKTEAKGSTALHIAAKSGNLDIVMLLLKYRAAYCLKNKDDQLPLDLASDQSINMFLKMIGELFDDAKNGRDSIIDKLKILDDCELKAVLICQNEEGYMIRDVAVMNGHNQLASKIVRYYAQRNEIQL